MADGQTPPPDVSQASEAVPPAAPNQIDSLVDAIITGASPAAPGHGDRPAVLANRVGRRRFNSPVTLSPIVLRWTVPALGAFVVGILAASWGLRLFESARTEVENPGGSEAVVQLAAPESRAALPAPATRDSSPTRPAMPLPASPPSSSPERSLPEQAASVTVEAPRPGVRARREGMNGLVPTPSLPAEPSSQIADRASPPAIAPALPAPGLNPSLPSTPSIVLPAVAAPLAGAASMVATDTGDGSRGEPAATVAVEIDAVLGILRDYEAAYESLDVVAAAEVWPSVDRRALSRAFSLLKSQEVAFDPCEVDVTGSSAVARCPGVARYVRRIGIQHPLEQRYRWVFDMRKRGNDWQIASVTTSRDDVERKH